MATYVLIRINLPIFSFCNEHILCFMNAGSCRFKDEALCAFEVLEGLGDLFALHIFLLFCLFCNNHSMYLIKHFYSNQNIKCQVHFDVP